MMFFLSQYRFYGEPVVKACIENGAHYVDICGEPQVGYHQISNCFDIMFVLISAL